ncbi:hypothetical protein E2562_001513 [Oryza meyeriana var. granulata]|uniref:Uncharacterized protein n=1 Tax=Oryza meyeriana var. granulata TaxID=110450 RepID=A0A6G1DF34_9ORYZ|nr:hypothetical protein E2562_001513 [Oryza meyeriana var. granulata]
MVVLGVIVTSSPSFFLKPLLMHSELTGEIWLLGKRRHNLSMAALAGLAEGVALWPPWTEWPMVLGSGVCSLGSLSLSILVCNG